MRSVREGEKMKPEKLTKKVAWRRRQRLARGSHLSVKAAIDRRESPSSPSHGLPNNRALTLIPSTSQRNAPWLDFSLRSRHEASGGPSKEAGRLHPPTKVLADALFRPRL